MEGAHLDDPRRTGVIIELRHPDGTPPYVVRWTADGDESLIFPGPDARIEPGAVRDAAPPDVP